MALTQQEIDAGNQIMGRGGNSSAGSLSSRMGNSPMSQSLSKRAAMIPEQPSPQAPAPEPQAPQARTGTSPFHGILGMLLGTAGNIAQDAGTGIRNKLAQPGIQRNQEAAKALEDQAYTAKDPNLKISLLQKANQIHRNIASEAQDTANSFSPDVNGNPLLRALGGATQIAGTAELPALGVGAAKLAVGGAKAIGTGARDAATIATHPTKGSINTLIEKGTQKGMVGDWRKAEELMKSKVFGDSKLSPAINPDPEIVRAYNKVIAPHRAIGMDSIPSSFDAYGPDILSARRTLLNKYGGGPSKIAQLISGQGPTIEQKIAGRIRAGLSEYLHQIAPDTKIPDKIYTQYAKTGSPAKNVLKYGIPAGLGLMGIGGIKGLIGNYVNN